MRKSILSLLLFFGCFVGTARGQTGVIALTVTSTPASIIVNQACNYVVIQENAATPTNAYTITLPGAAVGITEPAGTRFVFSGSGNGFVNGQSLGTITVASGSVSFVGIESITTPAIPVKAVTSGTGGSSAFNAITSGTNSSAAMIVGTGGSLAVSGSGSVQATSISPAGTSGNCVDWGAAGALGDFGSPCSTPAFNAVTSGTNTTAAMIVGTGGSLTPTGGGVISATQANGSAFAASATTDTTNANNIASGTVAEGRLPAATVFTDQNATYGAHTFDFSGVTLMKARVGAGLTTTVNGDFGYDTTNKNWHAWGNGVDNFVALKPVASPPANGNCVNWSVVGGVVTLGDAGSGCGTSSGGSAFNAVTSGTNTTASMVVGTGGSLTPTGSGTISATQANGTPFAASATTDTTVASNISSGTLPAARLPNPSASTLGGVESITSTAHNFLTTISTSGVPSKAQPACADLSNAAASCSTDATNATNIITGTLPHAQLPTLLSADIPNNAANTSGTAANVSGTPALPSGTTATTQTALDNSTKLATTAYVDAAVPALNPLTTIGDVWGGGASGVPARIAGGLTGQHLVASNGSPSVFTSAGVGGRSVSGTTDTILCDNGTTTRDRATTIQYTSASSIAVTLPQAGSSGCSTDFVYSPFQTGAGTQTITPTTSTINAQTTLQIIQNAWCSVSSPDNTNYLARCANYIKVGTGLTPTFNADGSTTVALATALPNGETATTQAAGDSSTDVATNQFVANNSGSIQLTSNFVSTSTSMANVAGGNTLQFSVAASKNYSAICFLPYSAATTSGGMQLHFTGPASPTNVTWGITEPTSFTATATGVIGPGATFTGLLGTNVIANAGQEFQAEVHFSLQNGTNAGTVTLQAASLGSGVNLTIYNGASCSWRVTQ